MSEDAYLNPPCAAANLDRWVLRTSILRAFKAVLPRLHGTLLDVGCGRMPYRELLTNPPSRVEKYLGMDMAENAYETRPDLEWDGRTIPLADAAADCAVATELLEHCPEPVPVLREIARVLKPGGVLFFTVPYLWPLHDTPSDFYRYTPFALERLLEEAGFAKREVRPMGGWHAAMAQMTGLYVRRGVSRPWLRGLASALAKPFVRRLFLRDRQDEIKDQEMYTGFWGVAEK